MKQNNKRKPCKTNHKLPHQWGKRLADDFDRIIGGKGNEGERKK